MTESELHRAIARATGESVQTIKRLGFLIADPDEVIGDPDGEEYGPYVIDWDELESARASDVEDRHRVLC